ncbi:MAG TPA: M48 family metallopeptidase, partial [Thermoanaerobaculia bacterium]
MNRRQQLVARPLIALALMMAMTAGVAEAQTNVKPGFNLFSAEQDVEIGRQSASEAERQLPVMNDREVNEYVNRIGQRLAANAGGPKFPYVFKIVNASDINAFALPGGPIYINRGIIESARNEGEVAGVIAHEIAHVALRHGTHQASKAYAAQAGLSILGGILGGKVGQSTANILNTVGGVGLNLLFLRFTRELETQADIRGAQILAQTGYSPADMVSFFHTLEQVDSSRKTTFLSDHPAPPDRIKRIEQEARNLRVSDNPTQNVAQLNAIKGELRGYGAAPTMAQIARGGTTTSTAQNGPMTSSTTQIGQVDAPSSTMRTYTSPSRVYRFTYPSNWKVYDQSTTGVTIAPEGGIGQAGNRTEIVYGLVVNHYDPFNNPTTGSRLGLRQGGSVSSSITMEQATQ